MESTGARLFVVLVLGSLLVQVTIAREGPLALNSSSSRRSLAGYRGEGYWSVSGTNFIDSKGNVVKFSGITWAGLETPKAVLGGLETRTLDSHMDQMQSLGFNMLRLPFAGATLLPSTYPDPIRITGSPDLKGLSSLEVIDKVIGACAARGIKVILDYHRMHLTQDNEIGTWWDATTPESVWLNNWGMLAQRYKGNPTIIGADLFNEVHPAINGAVFPEGAPFWEYDVGPNEAYNFRSATLRAIGTIQKFEPNWILFMEGMYHGPYWWGGNLAKLLEAPIAEPVGKIAYSAHDYGPVVADLAWFNAPDFPFNLAGIFSGKWGLITEKKIGALWIGEFGSFYPAPTNAFNIKERAVFEAQIAYIAQIDASWTLAFWGPDNKDTGSVLNADWNTVNMEKMGLLQPIMHPGFT